MKNTKTHEDLKELSIYVYNDSTAKLPKGWNLVRKDSNNKTGFYSETYKKGKEIAIVYRGTDQYSFKFPEMKDFGAVMCLWMPVFHLHSLKTQEIRIMR